MAASKPVVFDPPSRTAGDDPRKLVWICVDQILIDPNVQRGVNPLRLDAEFDPWRWRIAEGITLSRRGTSYYAVEGQHRVLSRQKDAPGTFIWAFLLEDLTSAQEAETAHDIAKGRKPHNAYQYFSTELAMNDPYWLAASERLNEMQVALSAYKRNAAGNRSIAAINAVKQMMHAYDKDGLSPEQAVRKGADLLSLTVGTLLEAFDEKDIREKRGMWERNLLLAVSGMFLRHPNLNAGRLVRVLERLSAGEWLEVAKRHRPGTSPVDHLGRQLTDDYNHALRGNRIEW